jgi:hypothetical protein
VLARFCRRRPSDAEWIQDFDLQGNSTGTYWSWLLEELRATYWMLFSKWKTPPRFAFHKLLQQS